MCKVGGGCKGFGAIMGARFMRAFLHGSGMDFCVLGIGYLDSDNLVLRVL